MDEDDEMEAPQIAGIAFNRDEAKLTVVGVPTHPVWFMSFYLIGEANIEVDVILQTPGLWKNRLHLHGFPKRPCCS